ncbi:MAG: hypothetical protein H7X78_03975 [Methyloceanibacter sp.]|nr:hypothetical protein [Methyloceanibacter sp.]
MIALVAAALAAQFLADSNVRQIHGFDPSPDCAEWTEARRGNRSRAEALEAWVTGVLTGYNVYHPKGGRDILWGTGLAGAFAWIDRRCAADPEEALPGVTLDLIAELQDRPRP